LSRLASTIRPQRRRRRPTDDWIQVDRPELRMVAEELWRAGIPEIDGPHPAEPVVGGETLWGKPANGIESPYLLTGMALCGLCHGALTIRSRRHGQHRAYFYQCLTNVQRGRPHPGSDASFGSFVSSSPGRLVSAGRTPGRPPSFMIRVPGEPSD
jgi:hypothetical protein